MLGIELLRSASRGRALSLEWSAGNLEGTHKAIPEALVASIGVHAAHEVEGVGVHSVGDDVLRNTVCPNRGEYFTFRSTRDESSLLEDLEEGLCAVEAANEDATAAAITFIVATAGVDNAAVGLHRWIVDLVAGDEDIVTWHLSYLLIF